MNVLSVSTSTCTVQSSSIKRHLIELLSPSIQAAVVNWFIEGRIFIPTTLRSCILPLWKEFWAARMRLLRHQYHCRGRWLLFSAKLSSIQSRPLWRSLSAHNDKAQLYHSVYSRRSIYQILGCIGGTHIPVLPPNGVDRLGKLQRMAFLCTSSHGGWYVLVS